MCRVQQRQQHNSVDDKATEDAEQDAFIGLIIPYVRIGLLSDISYEHAFCKYTYYTYQQWLNEYNFQ